MQEELGNPNFVYEIACDQMCGSGHTGMRGEIIVETQEEYDQWIRSKIPQYLFAKRALADAAAGAAKLDSVTAKSDTTAAKDSAGVATGAGADSVTTK